MRRHPLLTAALLLLLLAATAVAVAVATFDLNRHRDRLQALLSTSWGRPVRLGEAHLSLRHGLALAIADLRLPPAPDHSWDLSADLLYVRLEMLPLLSGELQFSAIVLEQPHLQIDLGPAGIASLPERDGWQVAGIRSIVLRRGIVALHDRRDPADPYRLEVTEVDAKLLDFAAGKTAWLSFSGDLRQPRESARLTLAGEVLPAADHRQTGLHLGLRLENLDPAPLLARYGPEPLQAVGGTGSLNLQLSGSTAAGLRIVGDLTGHDLAVHPPGYGSPQPIARARLTGTWHPRAGGGRLSDLDLSLDGLACRGELEWQQQPEGHQLQATLSTPPLPLPELLRRLPDRWTAPLRQTTTGGEVELTALHFAGPVRALQKPDENLPLRAELNLKGMGIAPDAGNTLTDVTMQAVFAQGLLQIGEGEATWKQTRCRFAGTLEHPFGPRPELTAEFEGTPESRVLLASLPASWLKDLTASGPLPFFLQLSGTRERLLIDLRADLTRVAAARGEIGKPAGLAGSLLLAGESTPAGLELSHARLQLPALELRGRGKMAWNKGHPFTLELDAVGFDLQGARRHWPLLAKVQARGELDLHLRLGGEKGRIQSRNGEIQLRGVGLHLTDLIADLQQTEGVMRLEGDRLQIGRLTTRLGTSPVRVEGYLENFSRPELHLRVRGKTVRADELIFPSPTMLLRDLDGHLRLSPDGIDFDPVSVRLDGGTRAEVRGTVRLDPRPRVELAIEASRGNIDEVISLWQNPQPPPPDKSRPGSNLSVHILARAAEGELGGMQFQQAEGLITWLGGILSIHPLHFRLDGGQVDGRVLVDFTLSPSLLQVSGHLEEVDAAIVHRQLLKSRGLVQGRLQGDFYLEGRLGESYLETSRGGLSLEIRDGVLHRFTSLAKVFSLLNVSQILTLQLPDMAREGMPFDRLSATFSLEEGILTTEDLLVDSRAMNLSLIGQADLNTDRLDFVMGVKPLRTVDQIVTRIPLAGWILAGEEKALITAHFLIRGGADDPSVMPVPITSISEKVLGIFRRVFNLPGKVIGDVGEMLDP